MKFFGWSGLLFAILLQSQTALAKLYTSPVLNEAANLVEVDPKKSKKIATKFLSQRKLTDASPKGPSAIPREETDNSLRTPSSSIDALQILAKVEISLGDPRNAFLHLENAERLANNYDLPLIALETLLLRAELLWLQTGDIKKALPIIQKVEQELLQPHTTSSLITDLQFRLAMLKGEIASLEGDRVDAELEYKTAFEILTKMTRIDTVINYHIELGKHYLRYKSYDLALTELLTGYWMAIEKDRSRELAKANYQLAQLFKQRQVLDKALEHLARSADFYRNYEQSKILGDVIKQMADIYFLQGKYNLALVRYFNVLDNEYLARDIHDAIELRLSIADTYLQLFNFTLSERYLDQAKNLVNYTQIKPLKARSLLLTASLALQQEQTSTALNNARDALSIGQDLSDDLILLQSYRVLSAAYEQNGDFIEALNALKKSSILNANQQRRLNEINEDVLKQQKDIIEQSLHYKGLEEELKIAQQEFRKFQNTAFGLFVITVLLVLFVLRRGYVIDKLKGEVKALRLDLYTHARSGLQNLRLLNKKLQNSLARSSATFEQWQLGELISEPFSDRLRFVMFDLSFLRSTYLELGYQAGLELERSFGDFIKSKVSRPARLYHFSDAMFLYVEPNTKTATEPQQMFDKICSWISEFEPERKISRKVHVGMADYPFLPRAYTAINDQELIDILLLSTNLARGIEKNSDESQWVYLRAIENAPAASFATDNIRLACKQALNQGLIKVQSSCQNEDDIKKLTLSE
ncbi:tetratricopeptide repeat protein [Vibrio sp. S9_S30]|uniref:tetratricopeptide repeat protein n=1 Tax=Vibrio sp. S9_S30 TaxID=2720226 RepID=UPI00168115F9|nr:tetratricopeptide repeat protein [Vibrio sp. S9_S30]MBD1555947.1 tetratricopeptide repeat protein [Vibrio sp. S9_S30]